MQAGSGVKLRSELLTRDRTASLAQDLERGELATAKGTRPCAHGCTPSCAAGRIERTSSPSPAPLIRGAATESASPSRDGLGTEWDGVEPLRSVWGPYRFTLVTSRALRGPGVSTTYPASMRASKAARR